MLYYFARVARAKDNRVAQKQNALSHSSEIKVESGLGPSELGGRIVFVPLPKLLVIDWQSWVFLTCRSITPISAFLFYDIIPECMYSVTKSCLTLCNPMDYSTSGSSLPHYLLELAQIHIH